MDTSRIIGRVSSVDSELLTVELDPTTPGYVKGGLSGIMPVGSINSYVTMMAGITKIVAVVTSIKITEAQSRSRSDDPLMSTRVLEASMIGRIEHGEYRPGIASYPALYTPVSGATPTEIAQIFKSKDAPAIRFGEAVVQPGQDVLLDAETLLAKHCAIVGSTGAGKSCSVMALLDGLLSLDIPSANIIVFDTNGEYAKAFESPARISRAEPLIIGGHSARAVDLHLPNWFMDNLEHLWLFRASEGVQGPLLLRSVADARLASESRQRLISGAMLILRHLDMHDALRRAKNINDPQKSMAAALLALHHSVEAFQAEHEPETAEHKFWSSIAAVTGRHTHIGLGSAWGVPLSPQQTRAIDDMFRDVRQIASNCLGAAGMTIDDVASDFDAPRFYSLEHLIKYYLPARMEMESLADPRIQQYASGMLLRIGKILADSRYNFFTRVPQFEDALALFLRLVLGWFPLDNDESSPPWRESYEAAQEVKGKKHRVTIIDLSAVGSDVLENVAALIARLILDFTQKIENRGSMPVLMVLEEAHRYVSESSGDQSRVCAVFERIAKEGRKFGVSLIVASQRPSELSSTVLAQCGTMIAHRIVSAEDQEIIRHATPFASREVLRQLSGLATQHAIVLGEAVPAPTYVRVRDVPDRPRSENPPYLKEWGKDPDESKAAIIDSTARLWENGALNAEPVATVTVDDIEETDPPF